jgi:hypothetical protein
MRSLLKACHEVKDAVVKSWSWQGCAQTGNRSLDRTCAILRSAPKPWSNNRDSVKLISSSMSFHKIPNCEVQSINGYRKRSAILPESRVTPNHHRKRVCLFRRGCLKWREWLPHWSSRFCNTSIFTTGGPSGHLKTSYGARGEQAGSTSSKRRGTPLALCSFSWSNSRPRDGKIA